MRYETDDRQAGAPIENRASANKLISMADFQDAANRQAESREKSSKTDLVNLGEINFNLSFDDPSSHKPLTFNETANISLQPDQMKDLDFGDIKDLYMKALDSIEQHISDWLSTQPPNGHADTPLGRPPHKPQCPHKPDHPDKPDGPDKPEKPDKPDTPNNPHNPDGPDKPDKPDKPDTPDKPDKPDSPDKPDKPDKPDSPDKPDKPLGGDNILFGGYTNGTWKGNTARDALEDSIGGKPELEQFYRPMGGSIRQITDYIQADVDRGILPEASLGLIANNFNYKDVASGKHDQYLHELAEKMGEIKGPDGKPADILMRPGWEMNLRFMQRMGTSEEYVEAYKHMKDIFDAEGADNVKFVWSPGAKLNPSKLGKEADPSNYWPGADYVDVIGPDGYSHKEEGYESFDEIFKPFMDLADRLDKPFMVSETGIDRKELTSQQAGDWWRAAFDTLQARKAAGLDVIGVAGFMKAGDFGWGMRDYTIADGYERDVIRNTFLND